MRIAAALLTAKRSNKYLILRKYGMLFHTSPPFSHGASAGHSRHPSAIAPHSAVPSPLGQTSIVGTEDGEERAKPSAGR